MARPIQVEIVGDSRKLEQAFQRSEKAAKDFNQGLERGSVSSQQRLENLALAGAKVGAGIFAAGRAFQGTSAAMEAFMGRSSEVSRGLDDMGDGINSLLTGDLAGFFNATQRSAERTRKAFEQYAGTLRDANQTTRALQFATAAAALGHTEAAKAIRAQAQALRSAQAATEAMDFAQRKFNITVIDGKNALVEFKGAVDSLGIREGLRGPGGVELERTLRQQPGAIRPVVETTVTLDGQVVGRSTKRYQSADSLRSPKQKRGSNAGR